MAIDPWLPWFSELEDACAASDRPRIRQVLEDLWRFDFHGQRDREHARWDRLFTHLLDLMQSDDAGLRHTADHYAFLLAYMEYGPPYDEHTGEDQANLVARRTCELIPVFAARVTREPSWLLVCTDALAHVEDLADVAPQAEYVDWLGSLTLPEPLLLSARIAYEYARRPWNEAEPILMAYLDHEDVLVRAFAARTIGRRYHSDSEAKPRPFSEIVEMITQREIDRPGIAGPFLSSWYGIDLDAFEATSGLKIDDWFCRILAHRKSSEPDTLPCSNGIDFFAHEVFGGRLDCIRKLIDMGEDGLAISAATEVDERIDDLEPILMQLGARADAETCRRASWHLAYHYRRLHPDGARRGYVAQFLAPGVDLFVNLLDDSQRAVYPYAGTLYPCDADAFEDALAWSCLDVVLPPAIRGELVAPGVPGDGGVPGVWVLGNRASYRFAHGALVEFYGDPKAKHWERITILWKGAPDAWSPALLGFKRA